MHYLTNQALSGQDWKIEEIKNQTIKRHRSTHISRKARKKKHKGVILDFPNAFSNFRYGQKN